MQKINARDGVRQPASTRAPWCLVLLGFWLLSSCTATSKARPNIILILADDIGVEAFSCYGSESCKTPALDRLAVRGARFENCHSQPLCTPSRVQLMTGLSNARNYQDFSILRPDQYTIGHMMKENGYATGIFGKWQLTGAEHYSPKLRGAGMRPENSGFDEHLLWQVDKLGNRYWSPLLHKNGKLMPEASFERRLGDDVFADAIEDFIDRHQRQPFFVYYPAVLVHNPFVKVPPQGTFKNDKSAGQDPKNLPAMVEYLDGIVARLEAHLKKQGLLDNTVIIFSSDNGTNVSCTLMRKGLPVKGGKGTTLDTGTHVPLIVAGPGVKPQVSERLVNFEDVMPTLAGIAQIPSTQGHVGGRPVDGFNLWPHLRGERESTPVRESIYVWYENQKKHVQRYIHDARWQLYADGRLFDNLHDPDQKQEIKPGASAEADAARQRLQKALADAPKRASDK
ncbi:MAG: hypothetical protein RL095_1075 [Verrucomicrobiota bacterium]|jgi:arylsulfatase A